MIYEIYIKITFLENRLWIREIKATYLNEFKNLQS